MNVFFGLELYKFENLMSKYLNMKYTIGVASGSSALYLALKSLMLAKVMR